MLKVLLAMALAWTGTAAWSDQVPEQPAPQAVMADLSQRFDTIDLVKTWLADFNGDGQQEALVQVAVPFSGGNAVSISYYYYAGSPLAARNELNLLGGIKAVDLTGGVTTITTYRLLDGDPRCCPSGETVQQVRF